MKRKTRHFDFILFALLLLSSLLMQRCGGSEGRFNSTDTTWAFLPFQKLDEANPILTPGDFAFDCPVRQERVYWERKDVFNPTAAVIGQAVYMLYRAEDTVGRYNGTSRLGLAISADGINFSKVENPILTPAEDFMKEYEWEGGIEDPRVVQTESGTYVLTYTAYDGHIARLCIATSSDFLNWNKEGLAFGEKYRDLWSKSGAIVAELVDNKMVAKKINGKYWMYFGDTDLFIATSANLIQWTPLLDEESGELMKVMSPRKGYFDSRLVESGPAAMVTSQGIVLIYNGMNLDEGGDPNLPGGTYSAGQALFDGTDPTKLINRLEHYFITPDKDYEITGQVNKVCFVEGLVYFNGRWLLYYGTADSKIAAAVYNPNPVQ